MRILRQAEEEFLEDVTFKAVLLMGGKGERLGETTVPKQFCPLGGKKVYQWSLETFIEVGVFKEIILVVPLEYKDEVFRDLRVYASLQKVSVCIGGKTRQESSYAGLRSCGQDTDFVLLHDAVRPFVTVDIILRNLREVLKSGACNTCLPVVDSIIEEDSLGNVGKVLPRAFLQRGQSPQTFRYEWIRAAHEQALEEGMQDVSEDSQLLIHQGKEVSIIPGGEENFKITSRWDLQLAELLSARKVQYALM